jgi:hypothetical protein
VNYVESDPLIARYPNREATIFMKAEAEIAMMYKAKYDEALSELHRLCDA